MYVIKNALRNISRAKGRNILIGIVILVIVLSSCIALSIRQAANETKEEGLAALSVTGQITMDRSKMMENARPDSGAVDKDSFKEAMESMSALSLEELTKYAEADSVKDFYYTATLSANGSGNTEAVETQPMGGGRNMDNASSGDFTLIGYSSDTAMTDFASGSKAIKSGVMFEEGTSERQCIISDELAAYNSLEVGDTIALSNPDDSDQKTTLKITGIYEPVESEDSADTQTMMGPGMDSANQIYMSYQALQVVSKKLDTDYHTNGYYTFADVSSYEKFEEEAKALGLSDDYTVTSQDITRFENSLAPLENLSKYALYFLIVVLVIGIIILIVINIFNIRERKYEIGVLTAMGMKKKKVALQFLTETLAITLIAIIIGTAVGAVSSVPITNSLLSSDAVAQSTQENAFDRGGPGGDRGEMAGRQTDHSSGDTAAENSGDTAAENSSDTATEEEFGETPPENDMNRGENYISSVSSATNLTVILQILLIGVLLSLASSCAAIKYIMRYEPLNILTNRD